MLSPCKKYREIIPHTQVILKHNSVLKWLMIHMDAFRHRQMVMVSESRTNNGIRIPRPEGELNHSPAGGELNPLGTNDYCDNAYH